MVEPEKLDKLRTWLGAGSINIFGPPFAGKDTQGSRLAQELNAIMLSGGAILRGSNIPKRIKTLMRAGELIPTNDYFELVLPYLKQDDFKDKPLILSSVGRWHGEEAGVLEATSASGHPIMAAIYLNIEESVVWERWQNSDSVRLTANRADDTYETLHIRLDEFKEKTLPVIDFYCSQNLLVEMNSDQPTDTVANNIIDALLDFIKRTS
jgi:adenylate kinase